MWPSANPVERVATPSALPERAPFVDPLQRMSGRSIADFGTLYWGRKPLLSRSAQLAGGRFGDLFSLAAVDELVSARGLRTPFLRLSRDGEVLAQRRFTRSGGAGAEIADQVADDKVLMEFAAGATLVLQGLHRIWSPLQSFATDLVDQLGHPVQVNAYVTPPGNTGFAPHYDVHDVFVLQFAGSKRWRVHEPVLPSPLPSQPWDGYKQAVTARAAEPPLIETVLEPGDALYLPRGFVHGAAALDAISGHLTVGIHPLTRHTIVKEAFATLAGDVALRRSLPIGVDLSDSDVLSAELHATIAALHAALDQLDPAAIARGIGRHVAAATRPAPLGPLEQLAAADALDPSMDLRLRPGLQPIVRLERTEVVLELADKELRLPAELIHAVRAIVSGAKICAAGLPAVDVTDGLTLLRRLLREGIVVPA